MESPNEFDEFSTALTLLIFNALPDDPAPRGHEGVVSEYGIFRACTHMYKPEKGLS